MLDKSSTVLPGLTLCTQVIDRLSSSRYIYILHSFVEYFIVNIYGLLFLNAMDGISNRRILSL